MPLSKARDRERKRQARDTLQAQGTALVSKALVRRLRRLGISPQRYLRSVPVSLDDYRALERALDVKVQRVEWDRVGFRYLRGQIATLQAQVEMQAQQLRGGIDAEVQQRLIQLEAGQVLHEAVVHEVSV